MYTPNTTAVSPGAAGIDKAQIRQRIIAHSLAAVPYVLYTCTESISLIGNGVFSLKQFDHAQEVEAWCSLQHQPSWTQRRGSRFRQILCSREGKRVTQQILPLHEHTQYDCNISGSIEEGG